MDVFWIDSSDLIKQAKQYKFFRQAVSESQSIPRSLYERDSYIWDLLTLNILPYDIDILDGDIVRELARRSVQKYENTVRLLRYNNHICYVNNINAAFQSFRCPNCDTFFIES